MTRTTPLKKALDLGREYWDNDAVRPAVRGSFQKVLDCGTLALGAEVFASSCGEERVVPHTCKSRACSSCGQRANLQWLNERWADLPEAPYTHVVLTMPDVFWTIFRENRHLLHDLPDLGARVLLQWVRKKYGAKQLLIVIAHTFGRNLKFNCHLHLLVSQGGLSDDESAWLPHLPMNMGAIMRMWRYTIVTFLRMAYRGRLLSTQLGPGAFGRLLDQQYRRWWHVFCSKPMGRGQILRYTGRYVRRPPIAMHRFVEVNSQQVQFRTKDLKVRRTLVTDYTLGEFVERLSHHIPDHYAHNVRYFGLLAPRTKGRLYDFIFHLLGQQRRGKPPRLLWAPALKRHFGVDPLMDRHGHRMQWRGRLGPNGER